MELDDLKERLKHIAELKREEVGKSEENVKQKIVVPLLECLGHHRTLLDFEYGTGGRRIDIFIKDLPKDCKVVIDTKNYDEDLDNHLQQIGLYAFQERAILALIVNGEEIRIYDPFFKGGYSFKDCLLYSIKRIELATEKSIEIISNLLSRDNLKSKRVKDLIEEREREIVEAFSRIEEIEEKYEMMKIDLEDKKEKFSQKLDAIQKEIDVVDGELTTIDSRQNNEKENVFRSIGLTYIVTSTYDVVGADNSQDFQETKQKPTNIVEIILDSETPKEYNLIPVHKKNRNIFPGYNVSFILETDAGEIPAKVTSARKGTKEGDPNAGSYIKSVSRGGLTQWYERHKNLKLGDKLIIEVVEPKKRYRLSISR